MSEQLSASKNQQGKENKYPNALIQTVVYPESDKSVRMHDKRNGLGTRDNLVGRLKDGYVDKAVYMIPDHDGNMSDMRLTGRIELNEHPSFDDHNQPVNDRLVEVASTVPHSIDENGETTYLHKWIREDDLANFERLGDKEQDQTDTAVEKQEAEALIPSEQAHSLGKTGIQAVNGFENSGKDDK